MKPNGTSLNILPNKAPATNGTYLNGNGHHQAPTDELVDELGDSHGSANLETPLREDAFDLSDALKIDLIEAHFREIMTVLGLDLTDDSLNGTPRRVAKIDRKSVV